MAKFRCSLSINALAAYSAAQVEQLFPDGNRMEFSDFADLVGVALNRTQRCFEGIRRKYFFDDGPIFNHLHSDQYAMFLYLLSNTAHRAGAEGFASKLFLLNKALHGLDAFYSIRLPEIFLFVHPVGTVLGNAQYGEHFVVYQNCTVGSDEDGVYPVLGDGVLMYARSAVLGRSQIGDDVVLGANTFVLHETVPPRTLAVGCSPTLRLSPNQLSVVDRKFAAGTSSRQR